MSLGLGFRGAVLGFGVETTYGTPVSPSRFVELVSDGTTVEEERLHSGAIPRIFSDNDEVTRGAITVSGDSEFEMRYAGMELLLRQAIGTVATTTVVAGVFDHTFRLADSLPVGLTLEVDRDLSSFRVPGGKINTLAFTIETGGFLRSTIGIAGQDIIPIAKTPPVLPTAPLVVFSEGTITYGGSAISVTTASFTLNNALKVDRRFIGSRLISEPQRSAKIEVTGTFSIEFTSLAQYTDFRAATSRALVLNFTSPTLITAGHPFRMTITFPDIKLTGGMPMIADAGPIMLELPFKAYAIDGATREFEIVLRNDVATI